VSAQQVIDDIQHDEFAGPAPTTSVSYARADGANSRESSISRVSLPSKNAFRSPAGLQGRIREGYWCVRGPPSRASLSKTRISSEDKPSLNPERFDGLPGGRDQKVQGRETEFSGGGWFKPGFGTQQIPEQPSGRPDFSRRPLHERSSSDALIFPPARYLFELAPGFRAPGAGSKSRTSRISL